MKLTKKKIEPIKNIVHHLINIKINSHVFLDLLSKELFNLTTEIIF